MKNLDKLQHLLDHLADLLLRTWSSFLVAKNLDPIIESKDFVKSRYFLVSVHISCVESSLLGFSKLLSDKKNEISVGYLFNMCNEKSLVLTGVSKDKLSYTVRTHQKQLAELKPLIQQVKMWRDRSIAHLDRKYVNDPSTIAKMQPVDMEYVGEGFILLQDLINVYRKWLGMHLLGLQKAETAMISEWRYLAKLIQQNGQ